MLTVTVYTIAGDGSLLASEPIDVDYVSLVNSETYGPPPLVAPTRERNEPLARIEDEVLYLNTELLPAFRIERGPDD